MSDEEVDELLKAVDTSSGEINYTGTHAVDTLIFDPSNVFFGRSRPYYPCQLSLFGFPVAL